VCKCVRLRNQKGGEDPHWAVELTKKKKKKMIIVD
jgi:hypothetical protein